MNEQYFGEIPSRINKKPLQSETKPQTPLNNSFQYRFTEFP